MGGAGGVSGVPGSAADAVAPFTGQDPIATLSGPSGRTRKDLSSCRITGRVASSLMLPLPGRPVGRRDRLAGHPWARLLGGEADSIHAAGAHGGVSWVN